MQTLLLLTWGHGHVQWCEVIGRWTCSVSYWQGRCSSLVTILCTTPTQWIKWSFVPYSQKGQSHSPAEPRRSTPPGGAFIFGAHQCHPYQLPSQPTGVRRVLFLGTRNPWEVQPGKVLWRNQASTLLCDPCYCLQTVTLCPRSALNFIARFSGLLTKWKHLTLTTEL